MRHLQVQCEHCGSTDVAHVSGELWRCRAEECGNLFDIVETPRREQFRRKARWDDDDEG